MRGHNVRFCGEIRKIILELSSITPLNCSSVLMTVRICFNISQGNSTNENDYMKQVLKQLFTHKLGKSFIPQNTHGSDGENQYANMNITMQ